MTTENTPATFVGTVEEDANGELIITFPEEMIAHLGWVEGDVIDTCQIYVYLVILP